MTELVGLFLKKHFIIFLCYGDNPPFPFQLCLVLLYLSVWMYSGFLQPFPSALSEEEASTALCLFCLALVYFSPKDAGAEGLWGSGNILVWHLAAPHMVGREKQFLDIQGKCSSTWNRAGPGLHSNHVSCPNTSP